MLPPKVMIISSVHCWDDPRIFYREALSLAKRYRVEVHALAPFKEEWHQGIKVVGLPRRKPWARPLQWLTLGRRALSCRAQLISFHDPDLIFLALFLRLCGRKVIYDVHELVAEDILTKQWLPALLRPAARWLYRLVAGAAMPMLSAVIGASRPISAAYRHKRKAVVRNYPPLELFSGPKDSVSPFAKGETLRLIYSGSLQPARGIAEMLEACGQLPESLPYHLDIVGRWPQDSAYAARLERAVEPVAGHVTLHGWMQFPDVVHLMSTAHIGLVCTQPNAIDPQGSPLKLYEYMAAGLGIVVADFDEWRPLTVPYVAAARVDSSSPAGIAGGIVAVADLLRNGAGSGIDRSRLYSWSGEEQTLLELYAQLLPVAA